MPVQLRAHATQRIARNRRLRARLREKSLSADIHDRDYFTARERALAWAGDLTRIIDHARTGITSLAWRP